MLYIATVHFQSDGWIPYQARYLKANIQQPFRVYSAYHGTPGKGLDRLGPSFRTHFTGSGSVHHVQNLNFLAGKILGDAKDTDTIMFLDGDAFPVSPRINDDIATWVKTPGLAAIRRAEGPSPLIPHPAFCVCSVGFWRELPGNWADTPWITPAGKHAFDTGTRLLKTLTLSHKPWHSVLRSNKVNLHELYFGLYGDIVYHHGAGFRPYQTAGWAATGAFAAGTHASAMILHKLMVEHEDFYKVFQGEKYVEEVRYHLRKRGFATDKLQEGGAVTPTQG